MDYAGSFQMNHFNEQSKSLKYFVMTITVHWRWSYRLQLDLKYGHTPQANTSQEPIIESRLEG